MANLFKIKDLAENRKISIRDLAERVGLKENQIHVMCRTNSTKIETLEKIAHELNVPVAYFFDEDVKEEKKEFYSSGEKSLLADHIDKVDMRDQRKGTPCQLQGQATYEELESKVIDLQNQLLAAQSRIIDLITNNK